MPTLGPASSPVAGVAAAPLGISTPTAGATSAVATPTVKASPVPDNNIATTQSANAAYVAANPNIFGGTNSSANPASSTTLSNTNKINSAPAIANTTNNLSNSGISTNQNGATTYANGTVYDPTKPLSATNVPQGETYNPSTGGTTYTGNTPQATTVDANGTTATGGYVNGVYYAPGQQVPPNADGTPPTLTATDPTIEGIKNQITTAISQADSQTTSIIQGISQAYSQYIEQQQQANTAQQARTNAALLAGGVTGQGSSTQYAPVSSANLVHAQVSYGLSQVADLQAKENSAVLAAQ